MLAALLLTAALAGTTSSSPPRAADITPPTPTFRHYGAIDGLPSATVYAVVQDHAGYLWIGTHAGLARYDTRDFRVFRHDPAQPASLPANDISALLVDRDDQLWVGGEGAGLNLYQPANGGFQHWLHDPHRTDSLSANDVFAIAQDRAGAIWVGVYAGGLNKLDANAQGFTHLRHHDGDPASLVSDNVTALAPTAEGGLWIGTDAGLDRMDARGHITHLALPGAHAAPTIWQLRKAGDGADAATSAGLFHIDADNRAVLIGAPTEALASLRGPDGNLWIARRGGLVLRQASGAELREAPTPGATGGLPGRTPGGLFRDLEGGLWVSFLDGGLAYLPPQWRAFSVYRHVPGDAGSLTATRVRALALAHDGSLWVGGAEMLDRIDPSSGALQHVAIPGLSRMSIAALAEDTARQLWIGYQHGFAVWDGKRLREVGENNPALRHGVWRLLATHDGSIYFAGVGSGVFHVDPQSLALQALAPPVADESAQEVTQLREAADGSVWAASHAGLARLAPGATAFRFVPGVARGEVDAFAFGRDGLLWVARSNGLQQFRLGTNGASLLRSIGNAQGWPDVIVGGLEVGPDGRVRALTPRGLLVFDPATQHVHLFATADGLATTEFTAGTLLPDGQGRLYAGSLAGVIGVDTTRLPQRAQTPQVALVSVSVRRDGRLVGLDLRKPIELDWHDRELTVTAQVLSYIAPSRNAYRFRLDGFDPDWVETGDRNVREFSVLEAGDYQLLISGRSGDGPWSAPIAPLSLHVTAPPWTTPWAWALYALALLIAVILAVTTVRRRLQQQHRIALSEERQHLAEQANAAKSRFLADMAHEIRTPAYWA